MARCLRLRLPLLLLLLVLLLQRPSTLRSTPFPHLCHQPQPVDGRLVDGPHLVEHKHGAQQHRQAQQLHAVLRRLVVRVDALAVQLDLGRGGLGVGG